MKRYPFNKGILCEISHFWIGGDHLRSSTSTNFKMPALPKDSKISLVVTGEGSKFPVNPKNVENWDL